MRTVAVNEKILVRLALLPGMNPADEPTPEEILQRKLSLQDPAMMNKMLTELRDQRDDQNLSVDRITAELHLYPRIRPATIAYVEHVEGPTGFVNVDVFTPGSAITQGAVGKIPKTAQQHFRLDRVQFYVREPGVDDPEDGTHFQNVAFWPPETDEEAPARLQRKGKK